jgi:cystathionine beta-lyase
MEGTYLPMIDLRAWVKPEETHDFIQGKCRLAVDYGEWFGVGYEGFIRMNLATDPVFVKQAAETIIREAKKLKEK